MWKNAPSEDILVYVIATEQPWHNQSGLLISYNKERDLCLIEMEEDEEITVRLSDIFDLDTHMPITNTLP